MEFYMICILIGLGAIAGPWAHEFTHYLLGKIGGGDPFISKWGRWKLFPREIDFRRPDDMSDRMVKLTGGMVLIYPVLAMIAWMKLTVAGRLVIVPLFIMFITASWVSWLDLLALSNPGKWKRYTNGEPITR